MSLRKITFAFLALFALPAMASAGPIGFSLTTTGVTIEPDSSPILNATLSATTQPQTVLTFDPATGVPTVVRMVDYTPANLPQPALRDIHPDGTTHWNGEGYFTVNYRLTDTASGESMDFTTGGRERHLYNFYGNGTWTGVGDFWFGGVDRVTLGGNDYTIWGPGSQAIYGSDLSLSVWVGDNPPGHFTPEPATFALAAFGLVPFALRRLRRG